MRYEGKMLPAGMERVCIGDSATLYLADALELIDTLEHFDVVLTDPPYGVEGGHGGQLRDYQKANYTGEWEDTPEYIKTVCVPVIQKCLEHAKTVAMTPGTRCCCSYPQPDEVGCFYAPASSRIGKFGFQNCHPIFFYGYYKQRGKGALHTVYQMCEAAEDWGHPCPKPIKAWTWLADRVSWDGCTILDPFMGSGTTGVAALKLGRRFIGIEIEDKYFRIACERIKREYDQLKMQF